MKPQTADKILAIIFLIAGFLALNTLQSSLTNHVVGIAFLIAAVYGIVCIFKKKDFLFN